jgi:hypothetical protein
MLPLDVPRFHERLSFRLSELIDPGVSGSSGLDIGSGDFGAGFAVAWARGPEGFACGLDSSRVSAMVVKSAPVLALLRKAGSTPLLFGTDDDRKGEMLGLCASMAEPPAVSDSDELVASSFARLPERVWWIELLLLNGGSSVLSSDLCREKKELLEAVIGVVGVFGIWRDGGGLRPRSDRACSWRAAILAAVGVLNGPRVRGGRRSDWFFLPCGTAGPFLSISRPCDVFLVLRVLWTLAGSGAGGIEMLPVELL